MPINRQLGFTLLELLIAITIISILAAIAIPNYQGHVRRSACEDAKGVLVGAGNVMERFRAQSNTYENAPLGAYVQSPVDGIAQFNIVASAVTATAYTLTATPVAGGRLAGRGTLTLTSTGVRGATNGATDPGFLAANVWNSSCRGL
ncbi:prepilin-type N-terminal cleavage/methylation domain-containing protein [Pseudomonas sp. WS 5011]|nr:prepilin-type N-terminal cleavage/methylation domain-containing protein [Pseudomonas sp. WS 5011]